MTDLQGKLDNGNLAEAISDGIAAVKADPTNSDLRYQLFAVLCFSGDLHRARKQLEALDVGDPELAKVQGIFINLLASEQERLAVFHHGVEPLLPPDPPEHLLLRLKALKAAHEGSHARADELLDTAVESQPELTGQVNGEPLTAIRDQDDLLGSQLEVFAGGRYLWLPFEQIAELTVAAPRHLLDLLWLPAQLIDRQGEMSRVHLPVLYVDSSQSEDPRAATARLTEWHCPGGQYERGRGQRLLGWGTAAGEAAETPILELRKLTLQSEE